MRQDTRIQDEWLALRCQSGEREAFEDLVAVMEQPLLYYAAKLTGSTDRALDVLQEAWIKAFAGLHGLREPAALRPWLYRLVRGLAVDRVRREAAREKAEEAWTDGFEEGAEPEFSAEDADAIHAALDQLPLPHREVLVLHFIEEMPVAEIAAVVGCPAGTVKSRIHHAKRTMKRILTGGKQ
jgi:RNA polymerase sigma-70 factor (ECF subfamily)